MVKCFICVLDMAAQKKDEVHMKDYKQITNAPRWPKYYSKFTKNTQIIRFTKMKYFLEMLEKGKNVLPRVSDWDDFWEGFIYKIQYTLHGNPVSTRELLQDFFGQCWSMRNKPSELMWRARCPDGDGVCMVTTVGQLAESVRNCIKKSN